MATTDSPLSRITLGFWQLSQVWEGTSDKPITTADALTITQEAAYHLDPNRAIARRFRTLQTAIIMGSSALNKATANAS